MGEGRVWKMQRHYSAIFSSIAASFFSLRVHFRVLSVCCSWRQSWKIHQFTGRSTKSSKGGLAHKKLYNKQIRHNCQPGKSNSVIKLLQVPVFFFHYFICREYWICPFHLIIYFIRLAWLLLHAQSRFFSYEEEGCPKSPFFKILLCHVNKFELFRSAHAI